MSDELFPSTAEEPKTKTPKPKRAFKGVWIPSRLWLDKTLSWFEKCLVAEIDSLDDGSGCYASASWLAQVMDSTPESIRVMLSKLRKGGWIGDCGGDFDGIRRLKALTPDNGGVLMAVNGGCKPGLTPPLMAVNTKVLVGTKEITSSSVNQKKEHQESEYRKFMDAWCSEFRKSQATDYFPEGGRDGKAVKRLLGFKIQITELVSTAKMAWEFRDTNNRDCFYCKHAGTIHGFADHFNSIQAELKTKANKKCF